jgi:16S rRNA U1498 N3-methylase RsmE
MVQLVMRLNPKDEFKIRVLKEKYGYTQTSELIRYLINSKLEEWIKEKKNQPQQPQKTP